MSTNKSQSKTILEITISIDGFVAGPDVSKTLPMGRNGIRLHDWIFAGNTDADKKIMMDNMKDYGAVVVGGNTYRVAIEEAWEGVSPFVVPALVVMNKIPDKKVDGFIYITNGIVSALEEAKKLANKKSVWLMGGARVVQSFLKEGLVDEMRLHLAPVLLGKGLRLFDQVSELTEWERISVTETPAATHLHFIRC